MDRIWALYALTGILIFVFGLTLAHFAGRRERRAMRGRARPRGSSMIR